MTSRPTSRADERRIETGLAVLLLTGCAEVPSPGDCSRSDEPTLSLATRDGSSALADGDEVEVFPPPQGGVFTELDVSIVGVSPSELEHLHVSIESTRGLGSFASVTYQGSELPMWCSDDEVLVVDDLPVGFDEDFGLVELDGERAVLQGTIETRSGDLSVSIDVVLQWTEY